MQECNTTDELVEDPILDAARTTVLDFGVRRTTLTEVARRAGLSRMTVYRRYADGPELMRALMTREFGAVLEQARREAAAFEGRERVVVLVAGTVASLIRHPLLLRLLELEPEMLLPYVTQRVGEFQRAGRAALGEEIALAQRSGGVRAGEPERLAETVELAARGFVLTARALAPGELAGAVDELSRLVEAYLQPN